jgi:putative heme transporter
VASERVDEHIEPGISYGSGELPPIDRDPSRPVARKPLRPLRLGLKTLAFALVFYFFVLPLIPGYRKAAGDLVNVNPGLILLGLALQVSAWWAYSLLTRSALGEASGAISRMRVFRIQMSTKALSNVVPGGSAAGSALGYRLFTLSGVRGADAGFALGTAGIGSAVVLNLLFWFALMVSIPMRGVNPAYAVAALAGVVVMLFAVALVAGLVHGQGRAERIVQWFAAKLHFDADRVVGALRQVGLRMEELIQDKQLLKQVVLWATLNWLLDAASLWVMLRAFGAAPDPVALLVTFGLANVMAVIPITPSGLGIVDGIYIPTLVGFGLTRSNATLGVASYRLMQVFLPIVVGAFFYTTLRFGPWSIERRDRLARLRTLAHEGDGESKVEFLNRVWPRPPTSRRPAPARPASGADGDGDGTPASPAGDVPRDVAS